MKKLIKGQDEKGEIDMNDDIGKPCRECGKIWTKEDEEELENENKNSFIVKEANK